MDGRGDPERTEIGGVRTLWSELPGQLTAALLFRVGRADETLRTHGISHLVEHLALWSSRDRRHARNGWVEDTITGFSVSGGADEVVGVLAEVTTSLGALPLDRLDAERRVLVAESATRGGKDPWSHQRSLRYGPAAYGLAAQYEFGIDWVDADWLRWWSASHFTADNAVLWLSGPPPAELELHLPAGTRRLPPEPTPIEGVVVPARAEGPAGGVTMSMVGSRSAELHTGAGILIDRAVDRLRAAGISYGPEGTYDILDGRQVSPFVFADCHRPDAADVEAALLRIVDELAGTGPTESELEQERDRMRRWLTDVEAGMTRLDWHARNELLGDADTTAAQLLTEREALSVDAVRRAMESASTSLLVVSPTPPADERSRTIARYDVPETPAQTGRRFVTSAQWRRFHLNMTVDVSDEGLTYAQEHTQKNAPRGVSQSVLFSDLVAAVAQPSGGLVLVSRTGAYVTVHAARFERGAELRDILDRAIGPDRVVPLSPAQRRLVESVADQLEPSDQSALGTEIDAFAETLGQREEIELLAAASRKDDRGKRQEGLLGLTDQRLIFLFCGIDGTEGVEVPRDGSAEVTTSGPLRRKLVITANDVTTTLFDIRPPERLDAVLRRFS